MVGTTNGSPSGRKFPGPSGATPPFRQTPTNKAFAPERAWIIEARCDGTGRRPERSGPAGLQTVTLLRKASSARYAVPTARAQPEMAGHQMRLYLKSVDPEQ